MLYEKAKAAAGIRERFFSFCGEVIYNIKESVRHSWFEEG
ncbi:hypothetical protein QY97_00824 [Bacillus thermotolerans]|uniref:Uncharacterized protein n=1 Tax=Bacillus thermotolerans TaxID=1221996 RepID=A0A0F5I6Q9_BACTR|nr:hypothetical protein QY97_00824 [Bacillus thermotolerans]KKB40857.1 hypothetical protein QY95_01169 [Bacillus thermotolerans]KKB41256.1 hypothetical protein QY96_02058 [Bacillus thermotolerans]